MPPPLTEPQLALLGVAVTVTLPAKVNRAVRWRSVSPAVKVRGLLVLPSDQRVKVAPGAGVAVRVTWSKGA